ncbi:MAG: hypothetical protein CMG69_04840 [Candidatus Marinimicrobia bacterium]|nr:hypothetical protein [Candidatus Neomarinimicrobiota bacterium]
MKLFAIAFIFFCSQALSGAGFTNTNIENNGVIQLQFTQGEVQYNSVGEYVRISSGRSGTTTDYGLPELPLHSTMVQIKADKNYNVSYTILSSSVIKDVSVFPFQDKDKTEAHGVIKHVDNAFYSGELAYPESIIHTSERLIMRDLHVLNIQVISFRFLPYSKELEIIESMEINISEAGERGIVSQNNRLPSYAFEPLYSSLVVNYQSRSRDEGFQQPAVLYICGGNSETNNAFQQLVDWRHKRGYVVYTVSVSETGSSTGAIKNYIQNAYNNFNPPPEFVGLVGDVGGSYSVATFDECWGHDWGGCEGDFPYTQLDGSDFLPEVFVGRISVNQSSQIGNIVNKIVHYEKATYMNINSEFYERAALVGDPSSSGMSTIITNEYVENIMNSYEVEDIQTNYGDGGYANWMGNQLEEGVLYLNYRGYVGVSGFGSSEINNANNGHKLPFATVLTCGTGDFASTSLTETFLRAGSISNPKGAIAAVGTATMSTHTMFNNIVAMGIYDGLFSKGMETTGASIANGKLVMYNAYPTDPSQWVSAFTQWNNLMGDPATHLWTDTPKTLQVIYSNMIPKGTNFVDLKVLSNGIVVDNAMVTLLKGNDEIFVSGYTNTGGNLTLPLDSYVSSGEVALTVTKRNFQPFEDTFSIIETGFIANYDPNQNIIIDEVTGNNDGVLNPGETVLIQIPVRNFGQFNITDLSAELSSESDLVGVIEPSSFYGSQLGAGETSHGVGFTISLSPSTEEMEDLKLKIHLFDENNNELGVGIVNVPVIGTKLMVLGYELISGNDNILQPGFASDIQITLLNEGSISGVGLIGELNFYGSAIQIYDEDGYWNSVDPGESQVSLDWFTIRPSINVINGSTYNMKLWLHSDDGFNREVSFPIYVGEISESDPLGPDEYGYYMYDSGDTGYELAPEYDWIEINPSYGGSGSSLNLSDDGYGNFSNAIETVNLPFIFSYYGEEYESITICTNGWISFGESNLESFRNYPVPGAGGPSPMVAVFWDDLKTSGDGNVYTYADPGNEFFVVEWSNMKTENYNSLNTFELILYNESVAPYNDGVIKMQYHTFNNTSSGDFSGYSPRHGGYCTVGLENRFANVGLQYTYDNSYAPAGMELGNQTAILVTTQPTINMTEVAVPIELNESWNLIGLPVDVENGDYTILFPEAISNTLYSFDEGYQLVDEMEIGKGYWLRFLESDMHLLTGIRIDEMTLDLVEGWNLISGISFDISLYAIADPGYILVPNTLYGFGSNGYEASDELMPGKGYWLRAYEAGTIFLSIERSPRLVDNTPDLDGASWISINGQKLFFDLEVSDLERLQFSLPPKPPEGAFDVRFKGDWSLCADDCIIEIMSNQELLVEYQLNSDEEWILTDINSEDFVTLTSEVLRGEFQFKLTSEFSLKKKSMVVPESYTLYPAFPNPFNPETNLRFTVPSDNSSVSLNIVNVRGQQVRTLVSSAVSSGEHVLSWDGTDSNDIPVSAGVYFCVLEHYSGKEIQKIILLK